MRRLAVTAIFVAIASTTAQATEPVLPNAVATNWATAYQTYVAKG